jgi:hypothetical protein
LSVAPLRALERIHSDRARENASGAAFARTVPAYSSAFNATRASPSAISRNQFETPFSRVCCSAPGPLGIHDARCKRAHHVRVRADSHEHARARQQRPDHFEARILGGGADEDDGAVLDVRQKRVLLRAIEAMDLVDEDEQRDRIDIAQFLCRR